MADIEKVKVGNTTYNVKDTSAPVVYNGTSSPAASLGKNGDIYVKVDS